MRIRTEKKVHQVTVTRGEDTATFGVFPMDPAESTKLVKKHTTIKNRAGQASEKTDWIAVTVEKVQKVIQTWDLEDESGRLLECNDINKKTAYLLNADIINEAMEKAGEIADGRAEIEELEIKNSVTGSRGSTRLEE